MREHQPGRSIRPAEGGQGHGIDAGLSAAREHDVCIARANQPEGVAYRIRACMHA